MPLNELKSRPLFNRPRIDLGSAGLGFHLVAMMQGCTHSPYQPASFCQLFEAEDAFPESSSTAA
eukprot:12410342-Karenia_brevis.AAC.1